MSLVLSTFIERFECKELLTPIDELLFSELEGPSNLPPLMMPPPSSLSWSSTLLDEDSSKAEEAAVASEGDEVEVAKGANGYENLVTGRGAAEGLKAGYIGIAAEPLMTECMLCEFPTSERRVATSHLRAALCQAAHAAQERRVASALQRYHSNPGYT
jgi:hypothetical protein